MSTGIGLPRKSLLSLSLAVAALPMVFLGCSGGGSDDADDPAPGGNQAAQVNATAVQDSVLWVANSVPGCKLNTGTASAASVADAQESIAGAGVVQQVMSIVAQARKAGAGVSPMAVQNFVGDCGGSLNQSDVHANGITTYTWAFNNFCSVDTTVSPAQQTVLNGSMVSREIGTPSASGPIVSSMDLNADQVTMTAKGETTVISVSGATVTYGVPDTWGPGDPTASNPDRFNVNQATVRFTNQNKTHTVSNLSGSAYESSGNSVMAISGGKYATTSHGYVNLATGQPIVTDSNGRWVSGSLSLTGSDGNTVLVTPSSSANGVMNVALNGQNQQTSLDCSGANQLSDSEVVR